MSGLPVDASADDDWETVSYDATCRGMAYLVN